MKPTVQRRKLKPVSLYKFNLQGEIECKVIQEHQAEAQDPKIQPKPAAREAQSTQIIKLDGWL
jgi:hypothetical protein